MTAETDLTSLHSRFNCVSLLIKVEPPNQQQDSLTFSLFGGMHCQSTSRQKPVYVFLGKVA